MTTSLMLCEDCARKLTKPERFWWHLSGVALCGCSACRTTKWCRPAIKMPPVPLSAPKRAYSKKGLNYGN